VIRLTVMLYIRSPLSLRQVEDLLFEPGIDICHETVRALVVPIRPDVRRGDPEQAIGRYAETRTSVRAAHAGMCGLGHELPIESELWQVRFPAYSG
jgi:hypothetical protein